MVCGLPVGSDMQGSFHVTGLPGSDDAHPVLDIRSATKGDRVVHCSRGEMIHLIYFPPPSVLSDSGLRIPCDMYDLSSFALQSFFSFKKKIDCFNLSPYLSGSPQLITFLIYLYD